MWTDLLQIIPQNLKQKALNAIVDVISEQAKKFVSDELSDKIKKLRSDAAFRDTFEEGLERALKRFIDEYQRQDEDLVAAIAQDQDFFKNEEVQIAMITVLKQPGAYLDAEQERVIQSFETILPNRINRQRVDRAVTYLLKCLAQELWHLPELSPIYSLQFQRITAESSREQVAIQKAQLQALTSLNSGIQSALLQLTDAIVAQKQLSAGDTLTLPPPPKVYHNLPQPDYGLFVGREEELERIHGLLRSYPHSRHYLVLIDGIGGIGKSALALEVAHHYLRNHDNLPPEEQFEAIIWTSAKSSVLTAEGIVSRRQIMRTLDDIYTAIAVALQREDITRARLEEQDEVVRHALTQQRTLLIVDNLETVDDENVLAFLRELPDPTKAIVTTRHRIDIAYPVRLVGMSWQDGQTLIAQESNRKNVTMSDDEQRRLYDRTGGIPLALVWSIAQMGFGHHAESVLTKLGQPTNDIARFCFEASVAQIEGSPAHKLLMALPLFVSDATREAIGFVADLPELDRDDGLVDLEKLSLLNKHGERFSLLPLTRTYVQGELEKHPNFKKQARRKWIDHLEILCKGVAGEYYWRYESDAFHTEADDIMAAIEWTYSNGPSESFFLLSLAAYEYLETAGYWKKIPGICTRALQLANSLDNQLQIARFSNVLGWTYNQGGAYEEAKELFNRALAVYRTLGNKSGESITLHHLGAIYRKQKDFETAKIVSEQSMAFATELGDKDLEALMKTEYGKRARDMGNWERARQYFSEVRDWFEERTIQIPRDEALARSIWGHMAIVALYLGRPDEAKELCLKSMEFFKDRGTRGFLATLTYRLGLIEEALGNHQKALEYAREALAWFERLGMKPDDSLAYELIDRLEAE